MLAAAEGLVPEKERQHFREFLAEEKRDFKMEDAVLALQRAREIWIRENADEGEGDEGDGR
jgi:hypothetical protein